MVFSPALERWFKSTQSEPWTPERIELEGLKQKAVGARLDPQKILESDIFTPRTTALDLPLSVEHPVRKLVGGPACAESFSESSSGKASSVRAEEELVAATKRVSLFSGDIVERSDARGGTCGETEFIPPVTRPSSWEKSKESIHLASGKRPPSNEPNNPTKRIKASSEIPKRLSCFMPKANPDRYEENFSACVFPGFPSMKRVMEHTKKVHSSKYRCDNCWSLFKDESVLVDHKRKPCKASPMPRPELLDNSQEDIFKKGFDKGVSEEDKWRTCYGIMHPEDPEAEAKSPYADFYVRNPLHLGAKQKTPPPQHIGSVNDSSSSRSDYQLPSSANMLSSSVTTQESSRLSPETTTPNSLSRAVSEEQPQPQPPKRVHLDLSAQLSMVVSSEYGGDDPTLVSDSWVDQYLAEELDVNFVD